MHRFAFSVLGILLTLPAFAGARLPVVNVAGGGVSARAAFGVAPVSTAPAAVPVDTAPVAVAPLPKTPVANDAVPERKIAKRPAAPVDQGEKIIAGDVLVPMRPSADLWAKNDMPLRMPDPSEFSVLGANYSLPEEDIDTPHVAMPTRIARADADVQPAAQPMSELDNQIARLVELQRRADESVRTTPVAAPVSVASAAPTRAERPINIVSAPMVADVPATAPADVETAPVKLSRMVVPMTPDVVVRTVEKNTSPRIASVRDDMTKMSPTELRKAFRKTFLSENKHLSTFSIDDKFDVASDMSASIEGFTAKRDLSEDGGIRPLEIKIRFRNEDSALSRENYNLLTEYASVVVSNPKRAIQVAIPQNVARNMDARKLAARRLAIVEQVLRDTGVSEQRIMPVLSPRDDDAFVLRIISGDQYETMTQQQRNIFGDTVSKKSYKSMSW